MLGLGLADWKDVDTPELPAGIAALADQRERARAAKQWSEADRLRDVMAAAGWLVEDSAGGQILRLRDQTK